MHSGTFVQIGDPSAAGGPDCELQENSRALPWHPRSQLCPLTAFHARLVVAAFLTFALSECTRPRALNVALPIPLWLAPLSAVNSTPCTACRSVLFVARLSQDGPSWWITYCDGAYVSALSLEMCQIPSSRLLKILCSFCLSPNPRLYLFLRQLVSPLLCLNLTPPLCRRLGFSKGTPCSPPGFSRFWHEHTGH